MAGGQRSAAAETRARRRRSQRRRWSSRGLLQYGGSFWLTFTVEDRLHLGAAENAWQRPFMTRVRYAAALRRCWCDDGLACVASHPLVTRSQKHTMRRKGGVGGDLVGL